MCSLGLYIVLQSKCFQNMHTLYLWSHELHKLLWCCKNVGVAKMFALDLQTERICSVD